MEGLTVDRDRFIRYNQFDATHLENAAMGIKTKRYSRRSRVKALTTMQVIKRLG